MTTLITYGGPIEARSLVTRTGGMPLTPAGFIWPRCAECAGPMQFLAQLLLGDLASSGTVEVADDRHLLLIFTCQNDPGLCDDWDPASGGNQALIFPRNGLTPAPMPAEGNTLLPGTCGIDYATMNADTYDEARSHWSKANDRPLRRTGRGTVVASGRRDADMLVVHSDHGLCRAVRRGS